MKNSALLKAAEKANLARVVDIMEGNPAKHTELLFGVRVFEGLTDRLHKGAVLVFQNGAIGAPRCFCGFSLFRPGEEITTLQDEGTSLVAFETAARGVFPISSVKS